MFMSHCGSVRRKEQTSFQRGAAPTAVSSPTCECVSRIAAPNFSRSTERSRSLISGLFVLVATELHEVFHDVLARLHDAGRAVATGHLVLEEDETVHDGLGARRAARHVA